jgi:hypothetical protein
MGWAVDRLAVCWPVSWDVVVAVDIVARDLHEGCIEGPAAQTGRGTGVKKALAGGCFGGLGRAIRHRGDWGRLSARAATGH